MFLVFLLVLYIHMYLEMHIIDLRSAGRCGNHGSPSEPRSKIRMLSPTIHIPRTVPFLSTSGSYGYLASESFPLPSVPGPAFVI